MRAKRAIGCALLALLLWPATVRAAGDPSVAALQVALRAAGTYKGTIDGVAGPGTAEAVRRFQLRRGLIADGVFGPATRRALGRRGRPSLGSRPIVRNARGWDVAALQFLLASRGFPGGPFDGRFGDRSRAALRRFQAWAGLAVDGVAGPGSIAAVRRLSPPRSVLSFAMPIRAPIGDRFGPRGNFLHSGIDFPAPAGRLVVAAGRGCVVTAAATEGGYGNLVVIQHRLGMTSWYAHLDRITVRPGECVVAGNRIGTVGSTGHSTGPHLHFELRLRGAVVDPLTGL